MKDKLLHYFVYVVLTMMFISMVTVIYWLTIPYKVLTFKTSHFPVLTKKVMQGGTLQFISDFCKYIDVPSKTSGAFINGIIFNVPTVQTKRDTGCHKLTVGIPIPAELPIGKIYFQRLYQFQVNPLRTISVVHRTDYFEVLESTKSSELRLKGY